MLVSMWIKASEAHPRIEEKSRNESVWLFEQSRGIFLGSYVEFGLDEPVDDHEYNDGEQRCFPSHFWSGDDKPEHPPRR